jgi:CRP-like cAMP-binding protein
VPAELVALQSLYSHYGVSVSKGEQIIGENDPTTDLYVVLKGSVEFSVVDADDGGVARVLGTAGVGDIFGEIACFTGVPRTATAVALEDSVLLKFERDTAVYMIRSSPDFAMRVVHRMAERLRRSTELITKLWH